MPKKVASRYLLTPPAKQKPPKPRPEIPRRAFQTASDIAKRERRRSQAKTQLHGRSKVRHY